MATILNPLASAPPPVVNYAELRQLDLQRQALDHEEMYLNTDTYISGLPKEDQDALNSAWEWAPDPESSKRKSVNRGYIGDFYGLPDEALGEGGYQTYRDRYAREVLGVPQGGELNDDSFFELMKQKQQKQKDYRGFAEYFSTDALNSTLLMEPKEAFAEAERIKRDSQMFPNMDKEDGDRLASHWVDQRMQFEERAAPLRPEARKIYDMLSKGKEDRLSGESQAGIEGAIDQLAMLDTEDRGIVVAMLKSQGGTDSTGAVIDKALVSAQRGLLGQLRGYSANTTRNEILMLKDRMKGELLIPDGLPMENVYKTMLGMPSLGAAENLIYGNRPATDEEKAQLTAIADKAMTRADVAAQAIGILEGTIDPVKTENTTLGRFVQRTAIDVGTSIGAMAPIVLPYAGLIIAQGGYADQEYQKLREEGNDPATAQKAAQITGAVQAGIERAAFLFNFVPSSTIARVTASRAGSGLMGVRPGLETSTTFRVLSKMGTIQAAEYGEEIGQAAAPIFTGLLGEKLGWSMAEQSKFQGEISQFKEEGGFWRPEVFLAVAALSVFGGGYSGIKDSRQAQEALTTMLGDQTKLEAFGIAPAKAAEIVAMPEAERKAAYVAEYPNRNVQTAGAIAAQQQVAAQVDAEIAQGQEELNQMQAAGVSITRSADGFNVVDDTDGTAIPHATAEEAMTTVRAIVKARGMAREDTFLDALGEFTSMMQPGRTIQLSNKSGSLLQELEDATTQNQEQWVESIWDRADQERKKVGMEVLERDKNNPDSAAALDGMIVLGRSKTEAKGNVARSISLVLREGRTLDLVEEQAENDLREAVSAGNTSMETMRGIIDRIEKSTGDKYLLDNTENGITEAWSSLVRLYTTGTRKGKGNKITAGARSEMASSIRFERQRLRSAETAGVTPSAFAKMREYLDYLKGIMGQVYRLQKARDAGLLDDLEAMIRESVGLKEQDALEAKVAEAVPTTYNLETGQGTSTFGYSISAKRDADYMAAVESGDVATQQAMVDEAAKESGLPILDDSASEAFRARRTAAPKQTLRAFKLFATKPSQPGSLFPLFVGANDAVPQGIWLDAIEGKSAGTTKTGRPQVKSKLGPLAFRPGWHAGDMPLATHIGIKNAEGKVFARRSNEVWAEVEMAHDVDYQEQANQSKTKDLREMPVDGAYRFKTNPNMTGNWIISGSMKIKRVLSQQEVDATLRDNGIEPMPWDGGELILENLGLTNIEAVNKMKLGDPITYDESGNVIPLSQRFNPESANIGYSIAPESLAMAPPKGVTAKTTVALPVWVVPKAEDALPKNIGSPAARQKFYKRLDGALAWLKKNPEKIITADGWVKFLQKAGIWGDVPMPPTGLTEIIQDPASYVAKLNGGYHGASTLPGTQASAKQGLDGTVEMRKLIGEGKAPAPFVVALHHMWGILSRMLPPLQQEGMWLRLIAHRPVLNAIQASIDGKFTLSLKDWEQLVKDARDSSPEAGSIGNAATANANSFYMMLSRLNGRWQDMADVYASTDSREMGRKYWDIGAGALGIKNKVQRFIGLTFGIPGVIMDRWKFVEFWLPTAMEGRGAATTSQYFTYGNNTPSDPVGIYGVYGGVDSSNEALSLAMYEAFETVLDSAISKSPDLQKQLGVHANAGGMHWHGWNAIKNEAVGHSSLDLTKDLIKAHGVDIDAEKVYTAITNGNYYTEGAETQQSNVKFVLDRGKVRVERASVASGLQQRPAGVSGQGTGTGTGKGGTGTTGKNGYSITTAARHAEYLKARESGNRNVAQRLVNQEAGVQSVDASIDRNGAHSPSGPEDGAPIWDATANGIYPDDIYTQAALRYYGTGDDAMDREAHSLIQSFRGNPNRTLKVYRALEKDGPKKIQPGEWVTTVRAYAKEHGMNALNGDYKIISETVHARDIFTSGDSWAEWGYHPQPAMPVAVNRGTDPTPLSLEQFQKLSQGSSYSITTAAGLENIKAQLDKVAIDPDVRFNMMQRASENLAKMVRDIGFRDDVAAAANDAGMAQMEQQQATALAGVVDRYSAEEQQRLRADEEVLKELKAKHETALQDLSAKADVEAGGAQADGWTADQKDALKVRQRLEQTTLQARQRAETLALETKQQKATDAAKAKERQEVNLLKQEQAAQRKANEQKTGEREQRATMLDYLAALDTILMPFPAEVRNKVGGFVSLAGLRTNASMNKYLKDRVEKLNKVLETYMRKEYTIAMERLLKKAEPTKGKPGEKMAGKLGPDVQHLMDMVRTSLKWTAEDVNAHIAGLQTTIDGGTLTAEQEVLALREIELVQLAGDWTHADAAKRSAAVQAATETYEGGYLAWKAKLIAKREAREKIKTALITDTGKAGTQTERDERAKKDLGWMGKAKDFWLSLSSFEELTRYVFGEKSEAAIEMVDRERAAAYQYEDATTAMGDLVQQHFNDLAGGHLKGEQLRFRLSQKTINTPSASLSELEAIQAILLWNQEDGKRHMIGTLDENNKPNGAWHYNQDWVDSVMAQMTPEGKATMAFIQRIYAEEWATLNPLYRERHGVNLPRHENYAPITVAPVQAKGGEMVDPVSGAAMTGSILTPGSLRTRSRRAIAEPEFRDALQTMLAHTKQMEHWKAYYDFAVDAQAILGNRDVGNAVQAAAGKEGKMVMRKWLDIFSQGGSRDAGAALAGNRLLSTMSGRAARMALVGRVGTLLIQSTQLAAASAEMPVGAYVSRLGRLLSGNLGWKNAIRSEFIQRRIQQAPPIVRQAMEGMTSDRPNVVRQAANYLGTLISGADGLFTSGTYAILLDYHMAQAAKLNITGPEAADYANRQAERITERVAQPTRMGTRSLFENTQTSPLAKLGWAFASEARQKIALAAWAARNAKADPERAARVAFLTWVVGGLMAQVIRNAWKDLKDDDDDTLFDDRNWNLKQMVASTLSGPLQGIPGLGSAFQSVISNTAGTYNQQGNLLDGFGKSVPALKGLISGESMEDAEPVEEIMKDVEAILTAAGMVNETAASATSLFHLVRDGSSVLDGLQDDAEELKAKAKAADRREAAERKKQRMEQGAQ